MPSPFPGMDPYLESPVHWPDFHDRFINTLCEVIADTLPEQYFARIREDVVLREPDAPTYRIQPDVLVGAEAPERSRPAGGAGTAMLEPKTLTNVAHVDPHTEHSIEIIRLPDASVVTVVEVLSPANKQGDGRGVYTDKRNRVLQRRDVNLVEIDLLRAGRRIRLEEPLPPAHYYGFVSPGERRPQCEVYSWTVRDLLPRVPIPLRPSSGAGAAAADLAAAFAMAYERGRYVKMIRYAEHPPAPAFSGSDAEWATSIARSVAR